MTEEGPVPWWRGARGEWWVAAQTVLLVAAAIAPPAGPRVVPAGSTATAGAVIVGMLGLFAIAAGATALGPSLSVLPRPHRDAAFVSGGVYRRVRHPIYTGVILLAAAWALHRGSLLHVTLAVVIAGFFATKAVREEEWLLERFPEYEAYRKRTKRFVPWVL